MKLLHKSLAMLAVAAMALPGYSAEETWVSRGTGVFRENFLHGFYNISQYPEVNVEVQESEQTPGRYRIVNPYKDYPDFIGSPGCYDGDYYIVVDASDPVHCYVETARTGYQAGVDQMLIVSSIADDYYNNRFGNWELADKEGVCGKLVDGSITFPPNVLMTCLWNVNEPWNDNLQWKLTDYYGMFRLRLPGAPNLDVMAQLEGINDFHTELLFNLTLGSSVEKALVALVPAEEKDTAADKIVSGEIASVTVTSSGEVKIPYTGDGYFYLVSVPYYEGSPRTASMMAIEIQYDESEWRKAGEAFFREGIISAVDELIPYGFKFNTYEYYVNVEENVANPGYIRLVDPYGEVSPLSQGYYFDSSRKWYLYIDASDPDRVKIEKTEDGIGLDLGSGRMHIWSKADRAFNDPQFFGYGYTDEQIKGFDWYGLFHNNEITFPKNAISINFSLANPGAWYEANSKGEFLIRFQDGQINGSQSAGINGITDDSNAAPVYYNLDGMRISEGNLTPGVYVVRKGSEVSKVLVK